jgi:hypothetical protein
MAVKKIALFALLLILPLLPLPAQRYVPPEEDEEEAPATLFSAEIGDADVELFLFGSWDLSITGSFGIGFNTEEKQFSTAAFPDMVPGARLQQIPDLTISLWLAGRYFFETTIVEDSEFNTFLLGYQGREEEFLRSVRAGNTEIAMDSYGYLSVSDPPRNSLGAYALMESEKTEHELLLRYDPSEYREQSFIGTKEITVLETALPDYRRGQFFILPDTNVETLTLYIEDPGGSVTASDGRTYRIAKASEATVDRETGTILFDKPVSGRIGVVYTAGNGGLGSGFLPAETDGYIDTGGETRDFSFSSVFLGQPMSDFQLDIGGETALLLQRPGLFSPFEMCNVYPFSTGGDDEDAADISGALVRKDDPYGETSPVPLEYSSGAGIISVFYEDVPRRDPRNRYPFAAAYPENYGPGREKKPGYFSRLLQVRSFRETDGYLLEASAVLGSIQVTVNGRPESRFEFDPQSAELTFPFLIFPDDRIVVRYKVPADGRGGNLNFGFGNRFTLLPGLTAEGGLGVVWNVLDGAYSTKPEESPGSLLLSGGLDYAADNFSASVQAGVSLSTPDTRGLFRISGMEESGFYFDISESNIFPASPPSGPLDSPGTLSVSPEDRGRLIYKNYRVNNFFTGTKLMPYTWDPPASNIYPYESGSKTGPYTAVTVGEGSESEVMVMDVLLSEQRPWAGGQISLSSGPEGLDLSTAESISFFYRAEDLGEQTRLFLHAGSISEDLDGDGIPDKEDSKDSAGFEFNDAGSGYVLLVGGGPEGGGNDRLDSEDINGNGILDRDVEELLVKRELPVPGAEWELAEIRLSADERAKLGRANAIRCILYSPEEGPVSGRLMIGGISVEASSLYGTASPPGSVRGREIFEFQTGAAADTYLEAVYPRVDDDFHADGSGQKILEITWENLPDDGFWECVKYTGEIPIDQYRYLEFYLRAPENAAPGTVLSLDVTDSGGRGLSCAFPLSGGGTWRHVLVEPGTGSLSIDGEAVENAEVRYEAPGHNPSKIVISGSGSSTGTLYIDELHMSESLPSLGAGGSGEAEWIYPKTILSLGGFPLLSDFRVRQSVSASTRRFASGFPLGEESGAFRSRTETDITFAVFRIFLTADLLYSARELFVSGGHRVLFPVQPEFINLWDSYRENNTAAGNDFTKSNSLLLRLPGAFSLSLIQEASSSAGSLSQVWKADTSTLLAVPLSFSGDFIIQKKSEEFERPYVHYFSNWGRSYSYVLPYGAYPFPEQTWDTRMELSVTTEPVGAAMVHTLGFDQFGKSKRLQRDSGSFSISLPVVFQAGTPFSWSMTPAYSREMTVTGTVPFGLGFPASFSVFGNSYRLQRYFYASPPYVELFDTTAAGSFPASTETYETAAYSPEASLTLSRNSGSAVYNLFVPSEGSISFGRNRGREQDVVTDERLWKFHFRNTALNLFGRLGAYPLFYFYETGEFSTILDLTFELTPSYALDGVVLAVQNLLFLKGAASWEFTLENRVDVTYEPDEEDPFAASDTFIAGFMWDVPAGFTLPLRFVPEKNRVSLFFRSTETLETTFGPRFSSDSGGISVYILVSHETKLIVPETGHIAAKLAVGFDRSSPYMWYMGVQGGIEGKISF